MTGEITTVADLIAALTAYPADAAVRLAVAPGYPQAAAVGPLACSPDDADLTGRERPDPTNPAGNPQCGSPKAHSWDTSPRSPATPSVPGHADATVPLAVSLRGHRARSVFRRSGWRGW